MGDEQWVYGVTVGARTWYVIATRELPPGKQDPAFLLGWCNFPIVQFFARNGNPQCISTPCCQHYTHSHTDRDLSEEGQEKVKRAVNQEKFGHVLR